MTQLVRLMYFSAATERVDLETVAEILEVAHQRNAAQEVTGMLCADRRWFLQCLEGGRNEVTETYQRIVNDARHRHLVVLCYEEIDERLFGSWHMGFVGLTEATRRGHGNQTSIGRYGQLLDMLLSEWKL